MSVAHEGSRSFCREHMKKSTDPTSYGAARLVSAAVVGDEPSGARESLVGVGGEPRQGAFRQGPAA